MENQDTRISQDEMIAKVIGAKYSIDAQIAIIRQKDAKPEEYEAFYAFAEDVKAKVKEEYAAYEAAEQADVKAPSADEPNTEDSDSDNE